MTGDVDPAVADIVSRTDLLLGRRGAINALADAEGWFEQRPVRITAAPGACSTAEGQSALITLSTLLRRAGFPVQLDRAPSDDILIGPHRGRSLSEVLTGFGVSITETSSRATPNPRAREVLIGDAAVTHPRATQLTWDGWVAAVRQPGDRLQERAGCILAPLLSAALVVSEIMGSHLGVLDACWRDVTSSLWDPLAADPTAAQGPALNWLPVSWLLIGLGHLGQANAWCLAHLPYSDGDGEVWLADDERITKANLSTGVLTEPTALRSDYGRPALKTRLVAAAAERAGRRTRLLESRLSPSAHLLGDGPSIALVGVDNLELRRGLSDLALPLAVDAGLGSTPSSFDSLALHVFASDGPSSHDIAAWSEQPEPTVDTNAPVFEELRRGGLDECGLVTLASKKVACAYVGMTAACLSVAEALRRSLAGPALASASVVLNAQITRGEHVRTADLRVPMVQSEQR